MFNATTEQIDSTEDAVAEIIAQLKDKQLQKNTFGIVVCHPDYIETGTIQALRQALPFDFVGCTVYGSAANAAGGIEQLSLTVLTSGELTFGAAFSDVITESEHEVSLEKVYKEAKAALDGEPVFAFAVCPVAIPLSGGQILKSMDKILGGIPVFGTLSGDITPAYTKSSVFLNDEIHREKIALLLVQGTFKPRFYTNALSARNIQQDAVVTESTGYTVSKINGVPLLEYLTGLGICDRNHLDALVTTIPLMVDLGDGTPPFASSMYNVSEQGVLCGSEIPAGSKISFASVDYGSVMETCETALRVALADVEQNGARGIIAIPCFSRALALIPNTCAEINKSLEIIGEQVPFSLIYSAGELCPVYGKGNELVNRFHNMTYTLMVF